MIFIFINFRSDTSFISDIFKDILAFLAGGGLTSYLTSRFVVQKPIINEISKLKNNIASPNKNDAIKSAIEEDKALQDYEKYHKYGHIIIWCLCNFIREKNKEEGKLNDTKIVSYLINQESRNFNDDSIIETSLINSGFTINDIKLLKKLAKKRKILWKLT